MVGVLVIGAVCDHAKGLRRDTCESEDSADSLMLENRVLRLEIRKTPAPFIERLVHKASGHAVVAGPAHKSLFSIIFVKEDGNLETIESAAAGESAVSVTKAGTASEILIKYAKFPSLDLAVEVTAVCDEREPLTLWTMRVANSTSRRLKAVRFPQLLAVPAIGDGKIPAAQEHMASYVLDEKTGKPKQYVLNESSPAGDWKRHSYQLCVSAPQTKQFFCDVIDQAHAFGVDVLQMDQTVSGAGVACYATTHGHAPGVGLYQSRAFGDLLDAMRQHGKRRSPDFVFKKPKNGS